MKKSTYSKDQLMDACQYAFDRRKDLFAGFLGYIPDISTFECWLDAIKEETCLWNADGDTSYGLYFDTACGMSRAQITGEYCSCGKKITHDGRVFKHHSQRIPKGFTLQAGDVLPDTSEPLCFWTYNVETSRWNSHDAPHGCTTDTGFDKTAGDSFPYCPYCGCKIVRVV